MLEMAIAQPLHAEVLRSGMPALRQQSMRRNLVEALRATGPTRTADRIRLACWSLELGDEVDPVTLALGADATLHGIGPAIAARLEEILPDAGAAPAPAGPAVPQDHGLATRLARAAYERSGGLQEGIALASTLAWTGATTEAESVLAELSGRADAVDDRVRLALALAWVRFWGRYDVEDARAGLVDAATEAETSGAPVLSCVAEVYEQLAGIALNTAQPEAALVLRRAVGHRAGRRVEPLRLGRRGRRCARLPRSMPRDAGLRRAAVPAALERGHRLVVPQLLVAQAAALAHMGELERARQLTEWLRGVALDDGLLEATAVFGVVLGEIHLRQGRPGSAARIFQDSSGLMAERDLFGYRPWALSGLARARALCGEPDSAAALLVEARRVQAVGRHFDMSRYLAEIELNRLAGRVDAAVDAARAGVAWARDAGMVGEEAQALEAWLRIAPSEDIARRLGELASLTDSELVAALAEYARAAVAAGPRHCSRWPIASH